MPPPRTATPTMPRSALPRRLIPARCNGSLTGSPPPIRQAQFQSARRTTPRWGFTLRKSPRRAIVTATRPADLQIRARRRHAGDQLVCLEEICRRGPVALQPPPTQTLVDVAPANQTAKTPLPPKGAANSEPGDSRNYSVSQTFSTVGAISEPGEPRYLQPNRRRSPGMSRQPMARWKLIPMAAASTPSWEFSPARATVLRR